MNIDSELEHDPEDEDLPVGSAPSAVKQTLVVEDSDVGERLDRYVTARCTELSRSRVQELIAAGLVLADSRSAKGSHRVHAGEVITVDPQPRPPLRAEAEIIPLDVLYEDEDVIAINKPAGMVVHAGAGNASGTLVNALLGRGTSLAQSAGEIRPGIVHRLDKETSGVILVAKNDYAHAKLGEAFRQRNVKKIYIALVQGRIPQESGRIEMAIGRDPLRRVRMAVQQKTWHGEKLNNPREARTDWRVIARIDVATLVEAHLHTGRTHQIRVHFSAIKHPVVGDTLYGAAAELRLTNGILPPLGRNFLHAAKLGFTQPRSGEKIEVIAKIPEELLTYLRQACAVAGIERNVIDAALAAYL